jgi:hypothetical protein
VFKGTPIVEMTAAFRVPIGLDVDRAAVRWHPSDGTRFTESFFDDTIARLRRDAALRGPITMSPIGSWSAPTAAAAPAAIILHVSRCGSTLLSRMLAALPDNLVVSEARIFDDILRGGREDRSIAEDAREAWLHHAVAAFAASQALPPARVVIKLDCWHVFEIARLRRAFPATRFLFVYRDPIEVLVSLMRRPSYTLVRDTVTPAEIGVTRDERDRMSREELAASILGAFFREAARHRAHLIPVPYESLPAAVWNGLPGLPVAEGDVAALRRAAEADAKEPRRAFVPDAERKRTEASPAARDTCARWADPHYERWRARR